MSQPSNSQREPLESELLVPFESQNIPEDYKEYYKTKRQNLFASIQGFTEMWTYYLSLDKIWFREIDDLKPQGDLRKSFPLMLYIYGHSKMRVSIELAFSGCLPEARSILRDAVEQVAYAHTMLREPRLQEVWLSKDEGKEALAEFKRSFVDRRKDRLFKGLDELYKTWGDLSETGSHATIMAMCDRFQITKQEDGGQMWNLTYSGAAEPRHWALSLFSMLLTCSTMERTFFEDYEDRLHLDHILMKIRADFETYKEQLREELKRRYNVALPVRRESF